MAFLSVSVALFAFVAAASALGQAEEDAMIAAMKQVRPDFLWRFQSSKIEQLRQLDPADLAGKYVVLNRLFEGDMPDRYHVSCESSVGGTYRPDIATRLPISDAFAEALLAQTAKMDAQTRKAACQKALTGSRFYVYTLKFKKVRAIVPGYSVRIGDDGYVPQRSKIFELHFFGSMCLTQSIQ